MLEFLYMFAGILAVFLVSFILINLRHVVTGNEFRGTCASNNPMLKSNIGDCTVCGKKPEEECKMPDIDTSRA